MKEGIIKKDEIIFLNQLINSLEEAYQKLETAYKNKDYENFNKLKKFILEVQEKISESLK